MATKSIIKLLLVLAHADKSFHSNEKAFLDNVIKEKNFPIDEYRKILGEVINSDQTYKSQCLEILSEITEQKDREYALRLFTQLVAEDYILHEDEMLLLQLIADEWGMYEESLGR